MADTAVPGPEPGENFYERITPEGVEEKAGQDIRVHDSEPFAKQHLRPEEGEPEALSVEDAARKLSERRARSPDLVRFERDGRRGPQTSEQAVHDLTFSKRLARAEGIAQAHPLLTPELAVQAALSIEKGGPVDEFKIDKADKAHPLSHGDSPEEARDRLAELRRARDVEVGALRQAEVESQQPQDALEPQAAPEAQQLEQPPPPPVDPLESERARVRAEAEALSKMRSATTQEIQLGFKAAELDRLATQQWGARIAQAGGFENFAKQDPQAARQVLEAKAAYDQFLGQAQSHAQLRQANEQMLQHSRAAELARVNRVEGERAATEFTKYVEARDPQWKSDPDYRQSLQKMAVDIVEEVAPGSSAAIQRGEMYVTAGQQRALYDVARARLSDERIRASLEVGRQRAMDSLPKVLRPGNGETRAEAAAHDFGTQLRALPSMSPTDAAKAGARLLAARRSGGRR
jgi:hypothetical protein